MGYGNVKALNARGKPTTTLSRPSPYELHPKPSKRLDLPSDETPDPTHTTRRLPTVSRFFRPKARSNPLETLTDCLQDDPYEVKSMSSPPSSPKHLSPPISQEVKSQRVTTQKAISGAQIDNRAHNGVTKPARLESPDLLAVECLEPSPPPVVSDLVPIRGNRRKRVGQPAIPEPQVKRSKISHTRNEPIDVSEDELLGMSPPVQNDGVRTQNGFPTIPTRNSREKGRSRGDIEPTLFRPLKIPGSLGTNSEDTMSLRTAVCGDLLWEFDPFIDTRLIPCHDDDGGIKSFHLAQGNAFQDEMKDSKFPEISMNILAKVAHSLPDSQIVCVQRRVTNLRRRYIKLYLEFRDVSAAKGFINRLPLGLACHTKSKPMAKHFLDAKDRASKPDYTSPSICSMSLFDGTPASGPSTQSPSLAVIERKEGGTAQPRREKLKDKMLRVDKEAKADDARAPGLSPSNFPVSSAYFTRRTRASSPQLKTQREYIPFQTWTAKHPNWQDRWKRSLVYPATGKNRATVDAEDIIRLDEGELLNDNLISFYLRYLQVKMEEQRPELLEKVYIFSSFFFERLKTSKNRFESVKNWTSKVDLLSYDYIIVPVNENSHWYLAIICNIAKVLPRRQDRSPQKGPEESASIEILELSCDDKLPAVEEGVKTISLDEEIPSSPATVRGPENEPCSQPEEKLTNGVSKVNPRRRSGGPMQRSKFGDPKIITLDSLGNAHSPTCKILREYLAAEAMDKKGVELVDLPSGMTGKGIPFQDNFCDCGVFVLAYMQEFLKDPDEASKRLLQKEDLDWNINPSQLRNEIRDLLFAFQEEQEQRLVQAREAKKSARRRKIAEASPSAKPSAQEASEPRLVSPLKDETEEEVQPVPGKVTSIRQSIEEEERLPITTGE